MRRVGIDAVRDIQWMDTCEWHRTTKIYFCHLFFFVSSGKGSCQCIGYKSTVRFWCWESSEASQLCVPYSRLRALCTTYLCHISIQYDLHNNKQQHYSHSVGMNARTKRILEVSESIRDCVSRIGEVNRKCDESDCVVAAYIVYTQWDERTFGHFLAATYDCNGSTGEGKTVFTWKQTNTNRYRIE